MSFERFTDDYRKILDSNSRRRAFHALNQRRNRQQCREISIRRHRSFSLNRFRTQFHRLFVTDSTITIRITKVKISTSIIISWTINSINSISEQRRIVNQTTIFIFAVNQTAIVIISIYQATILIVTVNQTSIIIFNFWITEQTTITLNWTSKRSINRSAIQQMRLINDLCIESIIRATISQVNLIRKTLLSEQITTINLAKIIHRVIISIDLRVSHTIIVIIILIIVNLTSCFLIKITSSFYLINSKEKILSCCINWIN
jgi:hypothetical protein